MPAVVSIVGPSGVGKTTLIERLLPLLAERGVRTAVAKHHAHLDFQFDVPGKDTWRFTRAGAVGVALASPAHLGLFRDVPADPPLDAVVRLLEDGADLILTEGYRWAGRPQIAVVRRGVQEAPWGDRERIVAVVGDVTTDLPVPHFPFDGLDALADFLRDRFVRPTPPGPWIRVLQPEEAEGELGAIYQETLQKRGKLAEVHKIHSLNPRSLQAHMDLYLTLMYRPSPLSRRERELVAVAVSRTNACPYCVAHHSDALARYEKDPRVLEAVREGRWEALSERDQALCRFAEKLTLRPWSASPEDLEPLRALGYDDRAILDLVQIVAYFNFVNRIVLALGVPLEGEEERQGYRY